MFALLLHKDMEPFYQNVSSFPTAVYTLLLIVCLLYWAVAVLGLVDLDILDIDGMDAEGVNLEDPTGVQHGIAGLLLKLGLNGVPLTIVITIVSLVGWVLCYVVMHFVSVLTPDWTWLRWLTGVPIFLGTLLVSALVTAQVIKPIRSFLIKADQDLNTPIIGQTAVVRSSKVDDQFGEILLDDGGAGLLLKARANSGESFQRGDVVVIYEHLRHINAYRVMSEKEFSG